MGKLLAIDGLNILRRVYEANPEPDSEQKAKAAIRNSLSSFRKLLHFHEPTHVLPAFDFGGPTWRQDLYPQYRAGRKPMPAELHSQLPTFYDMLSDIGLRTVSVPGVEADDVIGTVVLLWLCQGRGDAVIASTDKDLHVLIQYGALLWDHFKEEWHDAQWVENKFGVRVEHLTDFLALVGDRVDGVPGVDKIGDKTAAKLLNTYGSLEKIMGGAGILKNTLGERLRKGRDLAFLSRELIQLKADIQIGVTWKMLAYQPE